MRQPMTNGLAMLARWSVCQKLSRVSLVTSLTSLCTRVKPNNN